MRAETAAKIPLENEYRGWLAKTYSGRVLGDWVSRTRRVMSLIDLSRVRSSRDVEIAILKSSEAAQLSSGVRSQMKKAGRMYVEFRNGRNDRA